MAKIHLRANKPTGAEDFVARATCSMQLLPNGKVKPNSRKTYRYMSSEVVGRLEFAKVPAADRCAHCMDMGLQMRNGVRKSQGLPPLETLYADL